MNKLFYVFVCFTVLTACGEVDTEPLEEQIEVNKKDIIRPDKSLDPAFKAGDIIFQASLSAQCKAIQLATHSPYSHVGVIYEKDDEFMVFEAIGPVKLTPIDEWIAQGKDQAYSLKRLKRPLSEEEINKMYRLGKEWMGKSYDIAFDWSDDELYCSELVWKLYKGATGIELGQPQALKENDLTHPLVQQKLNERYGKKWPLDMPMISPGAVFDSEELLLVKKD